MHMLAEHPDGPLCSLGVHPHSEARVAEANRDTWFTVPDSDKVCCPGTGTRPGLVLAGALFDVAYTFIVRKIHGDLEQQGLLSDVPTGATGDAEH
eukprot:2766511-Lingulodinium_polyedra.AAC.1